MKMKLYVMHELPNCHFEGLFLRQNSVPCLHFSRSENDKIVQLISFASEHM